MKKVSVKLYAYILGILGALGLCIALNSVRALADGKPSFPTKLDYVLTPGSTMHGYQFGEGGKKYKISNLKSSNKSVVTVEYSTSGGSTFIDFDMHKVGKANITFTVKDGGKTYNYKTKLKIWKYSNPIKVLKIGNASYASKFKTVRICDVKGASGAFKLALNKGWKLVGIRTYKYTNGGSMKEYGKIPSKITLKKNYALDVEVRNTSKKYSVNMVLFGH